MKKKIAVIVPAYNEESAIANVVNDINLLQAGDNFHLDVVVVNDCSKDQTAKIVKKLNCILLDLPVNLGIGGAVQTGFKYAYINSYDYAIQVDGDGQHPPAEIPKLLNHICKTNVDIVIGSRFLDKKGFMSTFFRRIGIIYFKYLIKFFTGNTITDSTSGFRIINRKILNIVKDNYPDEYPEPESIILYSWHNFTIAEVPVVMLERQGGQSSIRAFTSLYYMLKVSIAIFFTYIRFRGSK